LIYKPQAVNIGWYRRSLKTNDDIYLGQYASPTAELESLEIKDAESWNDIVVEDKEDDIIQEQEEIKE
jgi:hypothetical protein